MMDNRGTDNQGSTVPYFFDQVLWLVFYAKFQKFHWIGWQNCRNRFILILKTYHRQVHIMVVYYLINCEHPGHPVVER